MSEESLGSWKEWASNAQSESQKNTKYISKMALGEYTATFMGAEMIKNKFGDIVPKYTFIIDGEERILESRAMSLTNLVDKEGQTVTLVKSLSDDGKARYGLK